MQKDSGEFIQEIKEYFDEKTVETQRHFDVVAEDLKSEIQTVAEQILANTKKLEEHNQRFDTIEGALNSILRAEHKFILPTLLGMNH